MEGKIETSFLNQTKLPILKGDQNLKNILRYECLVIGPFEYEINIFLQDKKYSVSDILLEDVNNSCFNFMCGTCFGIDMLFVLLNSAPYTG